MHFSALQNSLLDSVSYQFQDYKIVRLYARWCSLMSNVHYWKRERERKKKSHNAIKQTFAGNLLSSFSLFNNANNRFTSPLQPCIVSLYCNFLTELFGNFRTYAKLWTKVDSTPLGNSSLRPDALTHRRDKQLENLLPPAPGICRIDRGHISHIGNESVPNITINDTISLFFKLLSAFC